MGRPIRVFIALCVLVALAAMAVRKILEGNAGVVAPPESGSIRVATWNMCWLLEATGGDRIRKVKSVVQSLQPDVLAMQEVESRKALRRVLSSEYEIAMADDPREDQELALAVRKPVVIVGSKLLFADSKHNYAFPSRRNLLRVQLRTPDGGEIFVYVVHYKSRGGGRLDTDPSRIAASRLLLDYLRSRKEQNVIVLGDFNDTPGDTSVNILESGEYDGLSKGSHDYLFNLMQTMYDNDYVTQGYFRMFRGAAVNPKVRGAKADNDRLRGINYQFPRDVNVTQALFDQILVSKKIESRVGDAHIYFGKDALSGMEGRVKRNNSGVAIIEKQGTLASDHLPVFVDINLAGSESSAAPK